MSHKSVISSIGSGKHSRSSGKSERSKVAFATEVAELQVKLSFVDIETRKRGEMERLQTEKELAIAQAKLGVMEKYERLEETFIYGDNYIPPLHANIATDQVDKRQQVENYIHSLDANKQPAVDVHVEHLARDIEHCDIDDTQCVEKINTVISPDKPEIKQVNRSSGLDVDAKEFVPQEHSHITYADSLKESMQEQVKNVSVIAQTLAEQVSLSRLPVPEPSIFFGDPLTYPSWRSAFETLIERREIAPQERLYYLKRYLGGAANEAVEGYFLMNTVGAYDEAKHLLEEIYGNTFVIANSFREKLDSWPKIPAKIGLSLRKFGDFLRQCLTAMRTVDNLGVLNDIKENRNMVAKLPEWMGYKWGRKVTEWKTDRKAFPPFEEFVKFVVKEADIACEPLTAFLYSREKVATVSFPNRMKDTFSFRDKKPAVSLSTDVEKKFCYLCGKNSHELDTCSLFLKKSLPDRKEFIRKKGLCFACLKQGHLSKECTQRKNCSVCQRKHPTSLHGDNREEYKTQQSSNSIQTHKASVTHVNETGYGNKCSMILPVWVSHQDKPENEILVYALLDTQSDTTFILDQTCDMLNLKATPVQLMLSTMLAENQPVESRKVKGLIVRGVHSTEQVHLPVTYTRSIIPANRDHIPTPEKAKQWPHLSKIGGELAPLKECPVGLLIGYNCSRALAPREVIHSAGNEPYAQRTDLGWGIVGIVDSSLLELDECDPIGVSHRVMTCHAPRKLSVDPQNMNSSTKSSSVSNEVTFTVHNSVKEIIKPSQVTKVLELDFVEHESDSPAFSYDDQRFLKKMKDGIQQKPDGHYEMPLPFREEEPRLPNNKPQAFRRLNSLKSRFRSDPKFHKDYVGFMDAIIQNGHAELMSEQSGSGDETCRWYIPHHAVYHPKKPNKIRIVFDCSAKFQGQSLNDSLLQGPDLTNTLVGVLCRFRQEKVAFMYDVQQMFFQFQVCENHRDYFRFLWWKDGDFNSEPSEYRMKVHLFGATSSPACANYGLRQIASDYEPEVGSEAAKFLRSEFYVDDGLKSVPTPEEAVHLIKQTKELCARGGLRLHKFVSNSKDVVATIPCDDRAEDLKELNLLHDKLPVERALDVQWCVESDNFQFRITVQDQPITRRGILSTVCSIYDPLGFIAPVVMTGKMILQQLCREGKDWDDPLTDEINSRWEKWISELPLLNSLSVLRCFKPSNFGHVQSAEIHHFSDACNDGYGQCSYLRLVDDSDTVHCSFLIGKSRVAPLKQVTIPRLELTAAVVSAKMSRVLEKELEFADVKHVFWCDSKVVLSYIANDSKRFHVFVANRISQIRERSDPSQWNYIQSELNPADDGSRGLSAKALINKSEWLTAPKFLWNLNLPENGSHCENILNQDDPELKRVRACASVVNISSHFDIERLSHISDWYRAKCALARCMNLRSKLYTQIVSSKTTPKGAGGEVPLKGPACVDLTVENIQRAEAEIIRSVQKNVFNEELQTLRSVKHESSDRTLKKSSPLYRLDPFIDEDGILRVGGRLRRSSLTANCKHPVILAKKHFISELVIRYFHERTNHQGRGMTVNEIRANGFWIIG